MEPLPSGSAPALRAPKAEVQMFDLYSILFWSRVLDRNVGTQPAQAREDRVRRCDEVVRLKVGTANVMTLYPREEESRGMYARRLQLAQQL